MITDSEVMNLDEAQFLVSLALDQLGMVNASIAVVNFLGTNSDVYTKGNNQLRPYTPDELAASREDLENELAHGDYGLLIELINYLWCNPVLRIESVTGLTDFKRSDSSRLFTLSELCGRDVRSEMYKNAMLMFVNTNSEKLIVKYIFTQHFKHYYMLELRNKFAKSADEFRNNDVSENVLSEILVSFAARVERYSANGSYFLKSGNPVAFLKYTLNMFLMSESHGVYGLFNRVCSLTPLQSEDEGYSHLDVASIANAEASSIKNFIYLCYRINYASGLIFTFSQTMLSDIVTHYKESLLKRHGEETLLNTLHTNLPGVSFELYNTEDVLDNSSKIAKLKYRNLICNVMEAAMERGFSQGSLEDVYNQLLEVTNTIPDKDGFRLFVTENSIVSKKSTKSNSEVFKALLDGYTALAELIEFLESSNNTTGVTLFDLPVKIFQDPAYLTRFDSFEEYVAYVDEVTCLVEEVKHDGTRNIEEKDGFYINDKVHSIISSWAPKKVNPIVKMIGNMPIKSFYAALKATDDSSENNEFVEKLGSVSKTFSRVFTQTSYPGVSCTVNDPNSLWFTKDHLNSFNAEYLASYLVEMFVYTNLQTKERTPFIFDNQSNLFRGYGMPLEIMLTAYVSSKVLSSIFSKIGMPVVDDNGMYDWASLNFSDIEAKLIEFTEMNKGSVPSEFPMFAVYTMVFMHILFKNKEIDFSQEVSLTKEEIHEYWLMSTVVEYYLENLYQISKRVQNVNSSNFFLTMVKSVRYTQVLDMDYDSVSTNDLTALFVNGSYSEDTPKYYPIRTESISSYGFNGKEYDTSVMLDTLKVILLFMRDVYGAEEVFNKLVSKIMSSVQYGEDSINRIDENAILLNTLRIASSDVLQRPIVKCSQSLCLLLDATYNEDMYLVKNGRLYKRDYKTLDGNGYSQYYHRSGYVVVITEGNYYHYECRPITDEDLMQI